MPDFERLHDDLSLHLSTKKGLNSQRYYQGFIDGKNKARIEVALVCLALAVIVSAVQLLIQ